MSLHPYTSTQPSRPVTTPTTSRNTPLEQVKSWIKDLEASDTLKNAIWQAVQQKSCAFSFDSDGKVLTLLNAKFALPSSSDRVLFPKTLVLGGEDCEVSCGKIEFSNGMLTASAPNATAEAVKDGAIAKAKAGAFAIASKKGAISIAIEDGGTASATDDQARAIQFLEHAAQTGADPDMLFNYGVSIKDKAVDSHSSSPLPVFSDGHAFFIKHYTKYKTYVECLHAAAQKGHSTAPYQLAKGYLKDQLTTAQNGAKISPAVKQTDLEEAIEYFLLAHNNGLKNALCTLGRQFKRGHLSMQAEYFFKAVNRHNPDNSGIIGQLQSTTPMDQAAELCFKLAAQIGSVMATQLLNQHYSKSNEPTTQKNPQSNSSNSSSVTTTHTAISTPHSDPGYTKLEKMHITHYNPYHSLADNIKRAVKENGFQLIPGEYYSLCNLELTGRDLNDQRGPSVLKREIKAVNCRLIEGHLYFFNGDITATGSATLTAYTPLANAQAHTPGATVCGGSPLREEKKEMIILKASRGATAIAHFPGALARATDGAIAIAEHSWAIAEAGNNSTAHATVAGAIVVATTTNATLVAVKGATKIEYAEYLANQPEATAEQLFTHGMAKLTHPGNYIYPNEMHPYPDQMYPWGITSSATEYMRKYQMDWRCYLETASLKGHSGASHQLGMMYLEGKLNTYDAYEHKKGRGPDQDKAKELDMTTAMGYLLLAEQQGHPNTLFKLGMWFKERNMLNRIEPAANAFVQQATEMNYLFRQGAQVAITGLTLAIQLRDSKPNDAEAAELCFMIAASKKDANAAFELGKSHIPGFFSSGSAATNEKSLAMHWFSVAAKLGHTEAGEIVAKDNKKMSIKNMPSLVVETNDNDNDNQSDTDEKGL